MPKKDELISPIGVASWLLDNTSCSFKQIEEFTGVDSDIIRLMADGLYYEIKSLNPIEFGMLTKENVEAAGKNHGVKLNLVDISLSLPKKIKKIKKRKRPLSLRRQIPGCVTFIDKNCETLLDFKRKPTDNELASLFGSTARTVNSIRINNARVDIFAVDPVSIGLCDQEEVDALKEKIDRQLSKN